MQRTSEVIYVGSLARLSKGSQMPAVFSEGDPHEN